MYGGKQRVTLSRGKLTTSSSPSLSMMAIRHKNNNVFRKTNLLNENSSQNNKVPWSTNEMTDSSSVSWDGNSKATTSSSWPEEIEQAATRNILKLWCAIERTLYKEDEQVPLGNIMDECIQWRTQIPHFRVLGTKKHLEIAKNDSITEWNSECKSQCSVERHIDDVSVENMSRQMKCFNTGKHQQKVDEKKKEVINRILEFICTELQKDEDTVNNCDIDVESLSKNLDEVLTITPAPTYIGRKNFKSKNKMIKNNNRMSSAKINKSFQVTEQKKSIIASTKSEKNAKNAKNNDSTINDEDDSEIESILQHGRNKPGTIFNEKIVVSPVPYAVTTRESFCTLKTTPIRYAGHLLELSTPHASSRNRNSASNVNSAHKISYLRIPERHSAWQSSIYPVAWQKNVRLAPIDQSRLASSKKRSSAVSPSIPQRNRNSLSPISRSLKITFPTDAIMNDEDLLKIHGKQIVTSSAKPNLLKTGLNASPVINKDGRRKKIMSKSDR